MNCKLFTFLLNCNMIRFGVIIGLFFLLSCSSQQEGNGIFYVNSYHEGYPSSDDIMAGLEMVLSKEGTPYHKEFLDSKQNNSQEFLDSMSDEIFRRMIEFNPEVLLVSDDNALKYIVEKNADMISIPVVFCGINWNHSGYNLEGLKYTGILEILPVRECLKVARETGIQVTDLGILSENTASEKKNKAILDTLTNLQNHYRLVDNFLQWKEAFLELQNSCQLIFIPTNGGVKDWNDKEAVNFIEENIRVPVFTCDDFMLQFASFGLTKIAAEQGEWAGKTALELMKAKNPEDIPVAQNQRFEGWINPHLAKLSGFQPGPGTELNELPTQTP